MNLRRDQRLTSRNIRRLEARDNLAGFDKLIWSIVDARYEKVCFPRHGDSMSISLSGRASETHFYHVEVKGSKLIYDADWNGDA